MDLFCPDIVNNLYYWKQDKISGRSRVGDRPPLFLDQTEGPKKFCARLPPLISGSWWPAPPPLSEGLDLPLRIQATTLDRLLRTSYMWWMSQTEEKTSFQFPSKLVPSLQSCQVFPPREGRGGGWGQGYSHMKGVWGCWSSHSGSSGQNAIILSCNRWATPRLVSFRGVIQNFQWASPPISYGSPPPRDLSKIGLLLGYSLNWVVSFLQLVIWMGPGHWCPKPRKFGET